MDKNTSYSKTEALACVGASLILGGYLASAGDHLVIKVILMSFPPASLFVALQRSRHTAPAMEPRIATPVEPATFEEVTAGLEFDILTRAS